MENIKKRKILIMGAGTRGRMLLRYFKNCDIEVAGFLDNCAEMWGTEVEGVKVYCVDTFQEQEKDFVVIVSPVNSGALEKQLREKYSFVIGEKEANQIRYLPESAGYKKLFPLGHFYSLYPDVEKLQVKKDYYYDSDKPVYGIDFREMEQLKVLEKMADLYKNVPEWGETNGSEAYRAHYGNPSLTNADMIGLCCRDLRAAGVPPSRRLWS